MNNAIKITRKTKETNIELQLSIDGSQRIKIVTGISFLDHMINALSFHAGWDLDLKATGDIDVDDHHLVEDVAIVLGEALQQAWRKRAETGFRRFGKSLLPMDECLVLAAVDLSGRAFCEARLNFTREFTGKVSTEMWPHFFNSLSQAGQFTLHLQQMAGENNHHLIEAAFKALAIALRDALTPTSSDVSTKGSL